MQFMHQIRFLKAQVIEHLSRADLKGFYIRALESILAHLFSFSSG
jgi:hypothetical protein